MMSGSQKYSAFVLILCVVLLSAAGLLMLASTNAYATDGTAEGMGALKRQAVYFCVGLVFCAGFSFVDYRVWEKWLPGLMGLAVVLLALCYAPGVGKNINGESRWIDLRLIGLSMVRLQPSELGKFAALVFIAWWYSRHPLRVAEFWKGFVQPWLVLGSVVLLIAFERDLGTAALLVSVCLLVMFVVGVNILYLGLVAVLGVGALSAAVYLIPERMGRMLAFMDLEASRYGEGLQQWRAHIALGSGGLTGRGYGNGIEKMFYMPYAHTDFILPMIGEEFGLVGTLSVILCFICLVVSGMFIAASAPTPFGRILGAGIVCLIGCQALVNMGVTTALLPNKGLPLPFISHGGSSMLTMMICIGIIMSIERHPGPKRGQFT